METQEFGPRVLNVVYTKTGHFKSGEIEGEVNPDSYRRWRDIQNRCPVYRCIPPATRRKWKVGAQDLVSIWRETDQED